MVIGVYNLQGLYPPLLMHVNPFFFICEKEVKGKENKQQKLVLSNKNLKTDLRVVWDVDISISG